MDEVDNDENETATPTTATLRVVLYADGEQVAATYDPELWAEVIRRIINEVGREAAQP